MMCVKWYLIVALHFIFLITREIMHLFKYFLAVLYNVWNYIELPIHNFACFFLLYCLFLINLYEFLT